MVNGAQQTMKTAKRIDQCQLGEEKVYFTLYIVVYPSEMSGQKLEAGTAAEAMEEHCLLAFSA